MGDITGYIYAATFLIIAVYLFFYALKSYKFLFFLSGFFVFAGGWYLADEILTDVNLFEGVYSWIFRGVALVVLIICAIVYINYRKNRDNESQ